MKFTEKNIEWLVAVAVVLISTVTFFRSLMNTLEFSVVNGFLKYFTLLILFLIYIYQKNTYGIRIFDRAYLTFYLIYCAYVFVDITILLRYPLENMSSVPKSIFDYFISFVRSIGYLLCAKTIITHFNIKKYILLSLMICTIPSVLFIHIVGVDVIQAGIAEDDEEYISTLSITYSNMPILIFAVVYFKRLFNKRLFSIMICSFIIASVIYILFAYGKRGPILWSFVGVLFCYMIRVKTISAFFKKVIFITIIIAALIVNIDPILDDIKDVLPKTGNRLEATLKEGDTSGRFDLNDAKHSTYLIGLDNFSRSPVWGYYFRLVTAFKDYQGTYAHNIFIEILMTMGVLGFIPFIMFLIKAYLKSRMMINLPDFPNNMACFILFISAFLQLQTTGSCVFYDRFWFFLYILCCLDKLGDRIPARVKRSSIS